MSLIDDVCADPIFKDKVEEGIAGKIKEAVNGEEVATPDGAYNIQVNDVEVEINDITPVEGSADGLEVEVTVKGTSTARGVYIDSESEERDAEQNGTFEATIRVRLPSDAVSAEPGVIADGIEIDPDDVSLAITSSVE